MVQELKAYQVGSVIGLMMAGLTYVLLPKESQIAAISVSLGLGLIGGAIFGGLAVLVNWAKRLVIERSGGTVSKELRREITVTAIATTACVFGGIGLTFWAATSGAFRTRSQAEQDMLRHAAAMSRLEADARSLQAHVNAAWSQQSVPEGFEAAIVLNNISGLTAQATIERLDEAAEPIVRDVPSDLDGRIKVGVKAGKYRVRLRSRRPEDDEESEHEETFELKQDDVVTVIFETRYVEK